MKIDDKQLSCHLFSSIRIRTRMYVYVNEKKEKEPSKVLCQRKMLLF